MTLTQPTHQQVAYIVGVDAQKRFNRPYLRSTRKTVTERIKPTIHVTKITLNQTLGHVTYVSNSDQPHRFLPADGATTHVY